MYHNIIAKQLRYTYEASPVAVLFTSCPHSTLSNCDSMLVMDMHRGFEDPSIAPIFDTVPHRHVQPFSGCNIFLVELFHQKKRESNTGFSQVSENVFVIRFQISGFQRKLVYEKNAQGSLIVAIYNRRYVAVSVGYSHYIICEVPEQ